MKELPGEFTEALKSMGLGDVALALASGDPEVSVRLNPRKMTVDAARNLFGNEKSLCPVPWCGAGFYLSSRPAFALDPRWHQGAYYVQEAASMFVYHVVGKLFADRHEPVAALDACAAPGGKTTAVIDALPEGSLVVANEFVPSRAAILKENIVKWGYPATIVTRGDTRRLSKLEGTFDLVVADVPCSGEGMMRKDDEAVAQWSRGLVDDCATLQREIVRNLWPTIRPGGYLVYSTCTFNRRENELNALELIAELGGESVEIPVDPSWGITGAIDEPGLHAYRFIPGRTRGEGLFMTVIRKPEGDIIAPLFRRDDKSSRKKDRRDYNPKGATKIPSELSGWLTGGEGYELYATADRINAFPRHWKGVLDRVKELTDVIHDGVHVATLKGREYVPTHGLVMSEAYNREAFASVEIDRDTALDYLRGESPVLPGEVCKGMVTLTYGGQPLGLVKNLGNRTNTHYPKEWRLRTGSRPDSPTA